MSDKHKLPILKNAKGEHAVCQNCLVRWARVMNGNKFSCRGCVLKGKSKS